MADTSTPRRSLFAVWHWPRWTWAVVVMLMLLAYPLSMGPVEWAWQREKIPPQVVSLLAKFYRPVLFVVDRYPPARRAFDRYIAWWGWWGGPAAQSDCFYNISG